MRAAIAICVLGSGGRCGRLYGRFARPGSFYPDARKNPREHRSRAPLYLRRRPFTRVSHRPQYGSNRPNTCAGLIAAREQLSSPGLLLWHDRLRLDVAVGKDSEMFSWAGAASFETGAMNELAGTGATGSGAFGSFVASIFGKMPSSFGMSVNRKPLRHARPPMSMWYPSRRAITRIARGPIVIALSATTARSMCSRHGHAAAPEVVADRVPGRRCVQVVDTMDYTTVKIGVGRFYAARSVHHGCYL